MEMSLCMIVKDEEDVLARCLNCVKDVVDEMIIVDTGSMDRTKDIALEFTDYVYDFEWGDDFSKARNFSFSKASKDYILWLDADDVIDEKNADKIRELKKGLECDVVMMKYQVSEDMIFYRERLLKRDKKFQWVYPVHEVLEIDGCIQYEDITIMHQKEKVNDSTRNLMIYEKCLKEKHILDTRELFYYARELYDHHYFQKAIEIYEKFLSQKDSWIENCIEACLGLSSCCLALKDERKALKCLFDSFVYDLPRSEVLCEIGYFYFIRGLYTSAIYWYELALKNKIDIQKGGFVRQDCYHFIPYIQLCVCYDRLGDIKKAKEYNDLAGKIKPTDKAYLHNRKYFCEKNME